MDDQIYWIWLQSALGCGSGKVSEVLSLYGGAYEFYRGGPREWRLCGLFSSKELDRMEQSSLDQAKVIGDRCNELNQTVLTLGEGSFPQALKNISNPPCILYGKGQLPDFDHGLTISVVGTRSATPYGMSTAFDLCFGLAKAGAVVVSGGALGIDSAAHKGALQAGGVTVAILGGGINSGYLKENASLRYEISHSGALLTEFPPDTPVTRWSFPMRNRIISGLTKGTIVVEAGEKSGSLITANLALEQGRDVFAVPGNVDSSVSNGTNNLIKCGAKPVTCLGDVLEEYGILGEGSSPLGLNSGGVALQKVVTEPTHPIAASDSKATKPAAPPVLSAAGQAFYRSLTDTPRHIDDLATSAGLSTREALQAVTELELERLVRSMSGRRYARGNRE